MQQDKRQGFKDKDEEEDCLYQSEVGVQDVKEEELDRPVMRKFESAYVSHLKIIKILTTSPGLKIMDY